MPLNRSLAAVVALVVLALLVPGQAMAAGAARGVADVQLTTATHDERVALMDEYADSLGPEYLRVEAKWPLAEPSEGVYDETYLAGLSDVADLASARGIKLIITVLYTPDWAVEGGSASVPSGRRAAPAPAAGEAAAFGAFAGHLAAELKGRVFAYECWNEPNLWLFLSPQRTDDVEDYAARTYVRLLKAFYPAVKAADPDALVIGGATAPIGTNDARRTSPQKFLAQIKALGAADYMDAVSHHPYVPGGSSRIAPESDPSFPSTSVVLKNLGVLLALFPDKPFYLTEFGYNTASSWMFGGLTVSQAVQADYLRRAYRYAGRYSQVRCLLWYMRRDKSPGQTEQDATGVYTGLRTFRDVRKRSWFTFAGGTRLTLSAPRSVRRGSRAALSGTLVWTARSGKVAPEPLGSRGLQVQRRIGGRWRAVATVSTRSGGVYRIRLRLTSGARLRVVWKGVATSPSRWVAMR